MARLPTVAGSMITRNDKAHDFLAALINLDLKQTSLSSLLDGHDGFLVVRNVKDLNDFSHRLSDNRFEPQVFNPHRSVIHFFVSCRFSDSMSDILCDELNSDLV